MSARVFIRKRKPESEEPESETDFGEYVDFLKGQSFNVRLLLKDLNNLLLPQERTLREMVGLLRVHRDRPNVKRFVNAWRLVELGLHPESRWPDLENDVTKVVRQNPITRTAPSGTAEFVLVTHTPSLLVALYRSGAVRVEMVFHMYTSDGPPVGPVLEVLYCPEGGQTRQWTILNAAAYFVGDVSLGCFDDPLFGGDGAFDKSALLGFLADSLALVRGETAALLRNHLLQFSSL